MTAVKINYYGRLGNHVLMYLMSQYFAEKYDLIFDNQINDETFKKYFDVNIYSGKNKHNSEFEINDENVLNTIENDTLLNSNLLMNGFFQSPEILGNETIVKKYKKYISPKNINYDCDLYVHIRLGDITNRHSLPLDYYVNTISKISFSNGVVASDSPFHPIVQTISNMFKLKLIEQCPASTIHFGSRCKNLVLSAGTFSFLSAFYSENANIFAIDNYTMKKYFNIDPWGPDIFSTFKNKSNFFLYGD